MTVILPKPNEIVPAHLINPRIMLWYSAPKEGKTELCLALKNSLLLDLEDGSGFADGTKVIVRDLDHLNEIGGAIIKQGKPYDYIIVDTASQLADWCEDDATVLYKNSIIGSSFKGESVTAELPKGAGYYWHRKSYGIYFNALANLPRKSLIVLAHVKDKMLVDKKGREVDSTDIDLLGKLKQITCARADAIGFVYRKTIGADKGRLIQEIRVNFHGNEVNSGSRAKHLVGRDIFLSNVVNLEENPNEKPVVNWDSIFIEEKNESNT